MQNIHSQQHPLHLQKYPNQLLSKQMQIHQSIQLFKIPNQSIPHVITNNQINQQPINTHISIQHNKIQYNPSDQSSEEIKQLERDSKIKKNDETQINNKQQSCIINESIKNQSNQAMFVQKKANYRITQITKGKNSKNQNVASNCNKAIQIEQLEDKKQIQNDLVTQSAYILNKLKSIKQTYKQLKERRLKIQSNQKDSLSKNNRMQKQYIRQNNINFNQQIEQKNPIQNNIGEFSINISKISKILFSINKMNFPKLPKKPQFNINFQQLLQIARKTFQIFNICRPNQKNIIRIQKYQNFIKFTTKNIHILWYDNEIFYIGQYLEINEKQGYKEGNGIQFWPQKSIYEGQFKNNKKQGFGKLKFFNGDYYIGYFYQGLQHGKGKFYKKNNLIYNGQWKEGYMQGFGKFILNNKDIYEGFFLKGLENGYGTLDLKNGDTYKGEFISGKFNGLGTYNWANGETFQGYFLNGSRHGTGVWRSSIINGVFDQYCGQYKYDKKSGIGKYSWESGRAIYQGQFQNDQRHGIGVMKTNDNKKFKAVWQNGLIKNMITEDEEKKQKNCEQNLSLIIPKMVSKKKKKSIKNINMEKQINRNYFWRIKTKSDKQYGVNKTLIIKQRTQNLQNKSLVIKKQVPFHLYISKTFSIKQNGKQKSEKLFINSSKTSKNIYI